MLWLERKYLSRIVSLVEQGKWKNDNTLNHRCPYCGDSKKSQTKARGFVYRKKNDLFYKCHNCGVGTTLAKLIQYIDSKTYDDYIIERYRKGVKSNNPEPEFSFNEPVFDPKMFSVLSIHLKNSLKTIPLEKLLTDESYRTAPIKTYSSANHSISLQIH